MEWIELTKENFNELGEILAFNGNDFLVGYIGVALNGSFVCDDGCQELEKVTHYCELIKPE